MTFFFSGRFAEPLEFQLSFLTDTPMPKILLPICLLLTVINVDDKFFSV